VTSLVRISYPVDALVSYHYYADDKVMTALTSTGRLRLIGDSGAFSALTQGAAIDLGAYAAWVARWQDHLCWAASLDVIGDARASHRNWFALRDRYGLDTIPTLHAGTDMSWLDAYGRDGVDYVGLGGMAGTGQAGRAYRWAVHAFRYARDRWPDMRFHLWGVTNRKFLDHLPAYSADSSGILGAAYRFAQLRIFDPATGLHHNVALRAGQRGVYRLAPLLRRVYGVQPAQIETSHPGNRVMLIQLAAASTQQYAAWLQRRHQVKAPTYGLRDAPTRGTRVHMVAGGNQPPDLAALDADQGPRLHSLATAREREAMSLSLDRGPHLHLVDGAVGKLLGVTGRIDQENP
jgi:hypothetical protein